jgi:repressor of nif and glnA expression
MDELTVRAIVRGMFLTALEYDKNHQLSDVALKATIRGAGYEYTIDQVRHQMEYLEGKYLIQIKKQSRNLWLAKLTDMGTDVLEGRKEADGVILSV